MRNIIKKHRAVFCLVISFAFGSAALFAQEREKTPPDTTQKAGQKLTPQDKKTELELPDVLIYGTDRSVRMTGEKVESQQKDVKLIAPTTDYQSLAGELDSEYQKKHFHGSKSGSGAQTIFQLEVGRFNQLGIRAGRRQELKNYNYSLKGAFSRSSGQYPNSQYYEGLLDAQSGIRISPNLVISGNGSYQRSNYGLYGAPIDELTRQISGGKFKINSRWSDSPDKEIEVSLNYQQNKYHDRDTADYKSELVERNIGLFSGYQTKIRSYPVAIQGVYHYSRLNPDDDARVSQQHFQLKSSISFSIKQYVTLKPGLVYENLELSPAFSGNYFSPEIEIVATPDEKLGIVLKFSRGFSPLTYSNYWEQNQFVSQQWQLIPSKKQLDAKLGLEFNPASNVTVSGAISYQKWNKYSYWEQQAKSGLFTLNALSNVTLTTVTLQNRINLLPNLQLDAGVQIVIDDVNADSALGDDLHTPYLERFRLPVSIGYQFDSATDALLSFYWIGSRFISVNDKEKLSPFGLLQFNIERRLHNYISVFVKGDNLLNQDYQLWQNFPGMKMYFEIGVKGNW